MFHVDILGRPSCVTESVSTYIKPGCEICQIRHAAGMNEAVRRLCCAHNFDNHDVNYEFVNDRGPM